MSDSLDIILGRGEFSRASAPEPSLLPHLSRVLPLSSLEAAAFQARIHAQIDEGGFPIPALTRAVARVIETRAHHLNAQELYRIAENLPYLGSRVSLVIPMGAPPELRAYLGVREGNADEVRAAIEAATLSRDQIRTRAAALPLIGEADELLEIMLAETLPVPIDSLSSLVPNLNLIAADRLTQYWLDSGAESQVIIAGIVEMLPVLPPELRERMAERALALIARDALSGVENWRVAFAARRLRETARGRSSPELDKLAFDLGSPWRETVIVHGAGPPLSDSELLLSSDPYGVQIAGMPLLTSEAQQALAAMRPPPRGIDYESVPYRGDSVADELYLNAVVEEVHGEVSIRRKDAFARGTRHRVTVNLATKDLATGIIASDPTPLDRSRAHELYISFLAPWLPPTAPTPLVARPEDKITASALVEFDPPADLAILELEVLVLEEVGDTVTIVQSATLKGEVVDPGVMGAGITFVVRPRPDRPAIPGEQDVSIALVSDTMSVFGAPKVDGRFPRPGELREVRSRLGSDVLNLWATLEVTIDEKVLAESFLKLAARGRELYESVQALLQADDQTRRLFFQGTGCVRLVTCELDIDVPLEFMHDGPKPNHKKPELCQNFFEGLKRGECQKCRPEGCGALCAFDFWGFRRRIERCVLDDVDAASDKALSGRLSTALLSSKTAPALFGASERVKPQTREEILVALRDTGAEISAPVANWDDWEEALKKGGPYRLLVLLAHTESSPPRIEINGTSLDRQWLDYEHVNPSGERPGPIVLLTGCDTARADATFLSFVSRFLQKGAAVAIGTLASIREDVSGKSTRQILLALRSVIDEGGDGAGRTFGEVMRRARCKLLADRDLTGLNLVAYGDADWRL